MLQSYSIWSLDLPSARYKRGKRWSEFWELPGNLFTFGKYVMLSSFVYFPRLDIFDLYFIAF